MCWISSSSLYIVLPYFACRKTGSYQNKQVKAWLLSCLSLFGRRKRFNGVHLQGKKSLLFSNFARNVILWWTLQVKNGFRLTKRPCSSKILTILLWVLVSNLFMKWASYIPKGSAMGALTSNAQRTFCEASLRSLCELQWRTMCFRPRKITMAFRVSGISLWNFHKTK